jgi:hypothetical protein
VEFPRRRLNKRTTVVLAFAYVASVAALVGILGIHSGGGTIVVGSSGHAGITVSEPSTSFVQEEGFWGMFVAGFPLFATVIVASALWLRPPEKSGPGPWAVIPAALLAVEGGLGILTIGIFVIPAAVLLVFACATFSDFRRLRPSAPQPEPVERP